MNYYHPDDSGLLAGPPNTKEEEEKRKRKGGRGLLAPFMPGDKAALAQQMAMGFGGSPKANLTYLNQLYSRMPVNFNYRGIGGGGLGGGQGGGQNPGLQPGQDPNFRLSPVGWSPQSKQRGM
jgi:hypothetical protein